MNRNSAPETSRHSSMPGHRTGFTLVEMLVSVTLVLLMMTMFVSIFQLATDSVSTQQGISRHHQKGRAFVTAIKADFAKRTFRVGMPYHPGESTDSPTPFTNRPGFVYVSTNTISSTNDDVLQFTIFVNNFKEDPDDTPIYGASRTLYDFLEGAGTLASLTTDPNQPDADDGLLDGNNIGSSSAAQVSYFVRNGNLYRRVMLLREPLNVAGSELAVQPESTFDGNAYFTSDATDGGGMAIALVPNDDSTIVATNDFWRYFDYSAVPAWGAGSGINFVGIDALDNTQGLTVAIGSPSRRFGFDFNTGLPREHDSNGRFFGRPTHAETSATNFNYPLGPCLDAANDNVALPAMGTIQNAVRAGGTVHGTGSPFDPATPLNMDPDSGVILEFNEFGGRGGERRAEDLLLTNVHGMKVELWDDRLEQFVEPGHQHGRQIPDSGGTLRWVQGDYHENRKLNVNFGPGGSTTPTLNNVFDTWHPEMVDSGSAAPPPYLPLRYYPPQGPAGPTPASAPDPATEYDPETGLNGVNNGFWAGSDFAGNAPVYYDKGDVVFAAVVPTGSTTGNFWEDNDLTLGGLHTVYRCVRSGYAADPNIDYSGSGRFQPAWPTESGNLLTESTTGATAYVTGGGSLAAGYQQPAIWESVDNRHPLKAIRVTLQLYEPGSDTLRQLSVVLPMTKDTDF